MLLNDFLSNSANGRNKISGKFDAIPKYLLRIMTFISENTTIPNKISNRILAFLNDKG